MTATSRAFDRYRRSAGEKTTLARLIAGLLVVVACWAATTFAIITIGLIFFSMHSMDAGESDLVTEFLATPAGLAAMLLTFSGIWIGLWLAMRFIHREPVAALFGAGRRLSRSGFARGFAAVILTSLLSELLVYLIYPEIGRGSISPASWLLFLLPVTLLIFVQTSAEEVLFRGYLMRGLAARFSSPLVWFLLPVIVFTALHWGASPNPAVHLAGVLTIGAFALVLAATVWLTGNLGAAFGAHLANNLFGFTLISHQDGYGALALFMGAPLEGPGWTALDAVLLTGIGFICSALTLVLLAHSRSPLRLQVEAGDAATPLQT